MSSIPPQNVSSAVGAFMAAADQAGMRAALDLPSGSSVAGTKRFRVTKSANQSVAIGTETTVTWDTEDYDSASIFSGDAATIPDDEAWLLIARVQWENLTGAAVLTYKIKDGSTILRQMDAFHRNSTATEEYTDTLSTVVIGNGNPLTLTAAQTTGAAQYIQGGATFTEWTGIRLW